MKLKALGSELRAGIFVAIGIAVFTVAIFLLGQKSALFSRNTVLYARFRDVSGLVVGAPVRLAGLEVGTVDAISFPDDLGEKEASLRLLIRTRYMPRIRADSKAYVDSKGLLGDKVLNISMGDARATALKDGDTLETGQTVSFEALANNLQRAVQSVVSITESVELIFKDEDTTQTRTDLARSVSSLAAILSEIEAGSGLLHRIIYDARYADQAGAILAQTQAFAEKANRATGRIDTILAEVERGDGSLHALIYGDEGKRALASLGMAAQEIGELVQEVQDGKGILHTLVYEQNDSHFVQDLEQMSATLNRMVQDVDKGRGTLGGLLRDPTVYEDLKTTLGNVKRNVVFKALIRFTAEREQLRRVDTAPQMSAEPAPVQGDTNDGNASPTVARRPVVGAGE